ncbi:ABC transporter permease [Rhodoligotrophos defluvii]|uniref:ABC transporter permease n=1 Tax=Rhodoligotrophos defluvii TaxID=2561934 RepID=UPI0010C9FC8C|nr:ABC transporter permease [Rhodoligotrophos defluvii]
MGSDIDTIGNRLLSVFGLFSTLAAWEIIVRLLSVPAFILPAPSSVIAALWNGIKSGVYLDHLLVTLTELVLGFGLGSILGLGLGLAIALNRHLAYFLFPYIIMFQSLPKVALTPLIVLWFGLGITSKVVTAALTAFFPLMINTIAGLKAADADRISLIRSLGGSEFQIFMLLRLPVALPYIMAGLEIGLTFALIGTIVAEFLGAEKGLGMLMQSMNFTMDVAGSFSILFILSLLGLSLNRLLGFVRRRVLFWEEDSPSPIIKTRTNT